MCYLSHTHIQIICGAQACCDIVLQYNCVRWSPNTPTMYIYYIEYYSLSKLVLFRTQK